jgi:hypothetical protein
MAIKKEFDKIRQFSWDIVTVGQRSEEYLEGISVEYRESSRADVPVGLK